MAAAFPLNTHNSSYSQSCHPNNVNTGIKRISSGLPWQSSGKEFTCQCRGHGFDPWPAGRFHMPQSNEARVSQLLSSRSGAYEPQLLSPCTLESVLRTRVAMAMRNPCIATKSSRRSPQLKKTRMWQGRPSAAKNKQVKVKKSVLGMMTLPSNQNLTALWPNQKLAAWTCSSLDFTHPPCPLPAGPSDLGELRQRWTGRRYLRF